jgi:GTPase Era involved in 16S rRNA processing
MNYAELKNALRDTANDLSPLLSSLSSQSLNSDFADWCADLDTDLFSVVVVGEFNQGKSTLLNALFGQNILPVGVTPTTATVTILRFSDVEQIEVHFVDGRIEKLEYTHDALSTFVSSLHSPSKEVDYVEVGLPHPLLEAGIVYVDTPGVADLNRDRVEVTYRYVPRADVVIFVLNSMHAVTASEIDFLQSTILNKGIERLLFVSNFADLLDEEQKASASLKAQNKLAKALDRDDLPVLVLSAKDAFSETQRSKSGIVDLEKHLRSINADGAIRQEKITHLNDRLLEIVRSAKKDVEHKISSVRLEADAFSRQIVEVDKQWHQREEKISRIGFWVRDRQAEILAMTQKSMEKFFDALHEDLRDQIAAYSGLDFKGFVETHIPLMIKKQCKMWVDGHGDALRTLLMNLSAELTGAFGREFNTSLPMLEPRFVSAGIAVENVRLDSPEAPNGRLYAGLILGGASTLLMLTGVGLFLPMLSFAAFPWLTGKMEKTGLEKAKLRLMPEFDEALFKAAKSMRDRVLKYLAEEINGLQESAELKYSQLIQAVRNELQEESSLRDQPATVIQSRLNALDDLLLNLNGIDNRLSSLLIHELQGDSI